MFKKVSHIEGLIEEDEILFSTAFDYFFPDAARSKPCLLPVAEATLEGLRKLADFMADTGSPVVPQVAFNSQIPSIFTYFGQFIDHDITARTDRDGVVTAIGRGEAIEPLAPDYLVKMLRNGRRPALDLDSVFGDGPALVNAATTQSDILYDDFRLRIVEEIDGTGNQIFDLPRTKRVDLKGDISYPATIADMRNDENVIISQLHTAFLKFYNAIFTAQAVGSNKQKYIRARQLACWAYQYVVINDYLKTVCQEEIVDDTLANGPRFIGISAGRAGSFMPLEFSVAAFRFGHSMIRPFYTLNALSPDVNILDLLNTNSTANNFGGFDPASPDAKNLVAERIVDWTNFVTAAATNKARLIDPKIAEGLSTLPFEGRKVDPILRHLVRSNLFRGYNLSIPIGQAMCDAFGIEPLKGDALRVGLDADLDELLRETYFDHRTPLWYYLLREAQLQQNGQRLGELGSRIVCETIINLIKQDSNTYLNNVHDSAVVTNASGRITGINVGDGNIIRDLEDILQVAGVLAAE
ncbi:MAG: hypothetical protein H6657_24510 [Ardenticatenaceae bacterium]|nr:hypothetical protein [Ardenticatenaceae bacterium]